MDYGIASIIGSGIGFLGDLFSGGMNRKSDQANIELQKWMAVNQWKREDTSVQRRVKDLEAAGLSPVLAAGQGASSVQVMHPGSKAEATGVQAVGQVMKNALEMKNLSETIATQKKSQDQLDALTKKNEAETIRTLIDAERSGYDLQYAKDHKISTKDSTPTYLKSLKVGKKMGEQSLEEFLKPMKTTDGQNLSPYGEIADWIKNLINKKKDKK